ncbi:unnamed protein product [Mycena citricolor]|uniref:Uncharacterized protein n=1 Tax=Mycena citricolor TaxID=2018698 RepID=A0AAD2HGV2_9AGAR|nr:unnamed protein product [Mycena citricolor]
MEPEEYMSLLPGATVALTFELTHWAFKEHKRDHFTANIVKICVIEERRQLAVSPKKRRWAVKVDLGSSPAKKTRSK